MTDHDPELIDCHSHILASVDDGPAAIDEAIEMLRIAVDDGIRLIVATPHADAQSDYGAFKRAHAQVVEAASELRIEIVLGAEILVSPSIPTLLVRGSLPTLNGSRFPLIEFDFSISPPSVETILFDFQMAGFRPVIAHVERYAYVQRSPATVREWPRRGAILQVNAGSLRGEFGAAAMDVAWEMATSAWPVIVASDAHDRHQRSPRLRATYELVAKRCGHGRAGVLFESLPDAIVRNESIDGLGDPAAEPVDRGRHTNPRRWWHRALGC